MKVIFLGTGTSHGIPVIGCKCGVCNSPDIRNRRTRSSILIEVNEKHILVDAATELRLQAVREGIEHVDAILITHAHADHVFGLDDVRRFNELQGCVISCYGSKETMGEMQRVFGYVFRETQRGGGKPQIELHAISEPFPLLGKEVVPVPVMHGAVEVYGYRIEDLAYITDCSYISPESMEKLGSLEVLILDALRFRPHPTHFSVSEALEVVEKLKPQTTYFTHICHDLDYETVQAKLPEGVFLAYDGLRIELS